ncbi:MAG: AIR synthase-related protein, partial [Candidatus Brocadiaceae bacterium]
TIVNDLCTCGARPVSLCMYLAVGDASYLADGTRAGGLAAGFAQGCRQAGAIWAGGETQVLKGIVADSAAVLGGSALGRIAPKELRVRGDVQQGDAIIFLASSGVHTNGITLCRAVADRLPQGYLTELSDGRTFGDALLTPSLIYARFIAACQREGMHLHCAVHLTGHGWRKLMRPAEPFVYRVDTVPEPQPVFRCVAEAARMDDCEAYGTFNMGAGFAVYVRAGDARRCLDCAESTGHRAWQGGTVHKEGERKAVVIEPLGVTYEADSLQIR